MIDMLERICETFESLPFIIISGLSLIASFFFEFKIDPAWIAVIISGLPIIHEAVEQLIEGEGIKKISSPLLISTALIAALLIGDIFAAGEVAFIMALGEMLEDMTTDKAKAGIEKLISLTPQQARRIVNESESMIALEEIQIDDVIRILPGETIPVDGEIIRGTSSVDQSILTGESLPVDKNVGDNVFCGTINKFGSIDVKATKINSDSSIQKMIKMVQDAEEKKAPMQRIADKWASYLVPIAMLIAIICYIITGDIIRAVTVLIVFCPCALVLATPTAIMAAIGQATKFGVIIKSGHALELMCKVDTITFDKTGTLTFGKLDVTDIVSIDDNFSKDDLISLTASAESRSEHPLGKAILNYAQSLNVNLKSISNFTMKSGKGISAQIDDKKIICGNEKFIDENQIAISNSTEDLIKQFRSQGKVSILTAIDNKLVGVIALSDVLRPSAQTMVANLKALNTHSILLTGDNKLTAEYFANQTGIVDVKADLLPEEKVKSVSKIQSQGKTVCMIGDGVNDAPALKTADVGIAMALIGSDIAVDSADIALMNDDISKIPYLKRLSNATVSTIKLGITLSLTINFIAIILSLNGLLTPVTGALVHNGGSFIVIMIAALLYDRNFID